VRNEQRPPPARGAAPRGDARTRRRLATITRSKDEELRVNWSEYEGKPYLSIRLWTRDDAGGWWPSKTVGCTIRLRELADVAEALAEAMDLAEAYHRDRPRPAPQQRQPTRGDINRRWDPSQLPGVDADPSGFDEFGGHDPRK
jgi:hypothetical protein